MTRRNGERAIVRRRKFLSRAKRALECGGPPRDGFAAANLTPLFVVQRHEVEIKRKVRGREDALASTRDACATQSLRFNAQ
jgi:hypothetical protein